MRIRYTDQQKQEAMQRCDEIGVKKTSETLGISVQTLYHWRRGEAAAAAEPSMDTADYAKAREMAASLLGEDDTAERVTRLEQENARLREMNTKLRKALAAFIA